MSEKKLPVVGPRDPVERLIAGDSAGVIAELRELLERDPDDERAWLQLGMAYHHIGHGVEAVQAFERAVELDAGSVEARRLYARALGRLRRHDEAVFQLVQAKRLAPEDARVLKELGVAFYDKRLYTKAERELTAARALAPEDARIPYSLGLVHEARGEMARAIVCYRETVRLEPTFVEARRTLADALAAMGEMKEAAAELEEALRLDRTNTQIAMNLEVLQQGLRELEAARLLDKPAAAVERSTLVQRGKLERKPAQPHAGLPVVRYGAELAELWVTLDASGSVDELTLVLPDPERAARAPGRPFQVEVVSQEGRRVAADYATAITLTFLREALGCPMTAASELYARLLADRKALAWGGAEIGFAEVERAGERHHGVYAARAKR